MPIYKKHKVFSEKLTSIEDPIAVVQRGVITYAPSKGHALLIPTQIANPVNLKLTAMSSQTAMTLTGSLSEVWYCDLSLHYATHAASSAFGSLASIVTIDEIGKRLRLVDSKLYVATASMAEDSASDSGVDDTASTSWRQLEEFGSNAKKYLVVTTPNSASIAFKIFRQRLAYEVIGYEY